jgi:hypothetical protein
MVELYLDSHMSVWHGAKIIIHNVEFNYSLAVIFSHFCSNSYQK